MNHNSKNLELIDVHMESDDEIMHGIESKLSNACITHEELQTLRKFASQQQKGFMPDKSDNMDFSNLYLLPPPKTRDFEEMLKSLLEFKKQNDFSKKLRNKNKITTERNNEAGDDDKDEDDQNSDKTFDCSDCSINPINDESDLEPDIITCQFIKIKNRPVKWQKKCETELTKLSGKSYGVDELQDFISWS